MRYPKINSLYKRADEKKGALIMGDYASPEFACIKQWRVEEKIDGTNIRVYFDFSQDDINIYEIKGRNEDSMLPKNLVQYFKEYITPSRINLLKDFMNTKSRVILFGEGYGPKIQSGDNYRDDIGFILFDVWGGHRWSTREELKGLADILGLPFPYDFGLMTEEEIISFVKSRPQSKVAIRPMEIEGVVCRTEPLMRNNLSGDPVMFKLKCKEF